MPPTLLNPPHLVQCRASLPPRADHTRNLSLPARRTIHPILPIRLPLQLANVRRYSFEFHIPKTLPSSPKPVNTKVYKNHQRPQNLHRQSKRQSTEGVWGSRFPVEHSPFPFPFEEKLPHSSKGKTSKNYLEQKELSQNFLGTKHGVYNYPPTSNSGGRGAPGGDGLAHKKNA